LGGVFGEIAMAEASGRRPYLHAPPDAAAPPQTLAWLARGLPTTQVAELIDRLITDLDRRLGDCDIEGEDLA
jgi:hypothetical protein